MGVHAGLKLFWVIAALALMLCTLGYQSRKLDPEDSATKYSKETCVSMFHLLEEQTIRLRNVEETLLRTLTILTSNNGQDFAATAAALKSNLQILSFRSSKSNNLFISNMLSPPLSDDWFGSSGRKKRQTEEQVITTLNPGLRNRTEAPLRHANDPEDESQSTATKYDPLPELRVEDSFSDKDVQPTSRHLFSRTQLTDDFILTNFNNTDTAPGPSANSGFIQNTALQAVNTKSLNAMATQKFVNDSINDFQGAVKCAMAQLDNGNLTERLGILFEPEVTLDFDKSLTVQFEMRNCQKYWTAVWIVIKKKSIDMKNSSTVSLDSRSLFVVPKSCLKKRGNVFWLNLPSNAKAPCSFPMSKVTECEVYNIDIIPIYYTLHGQLSNLEFTVPPKMDSNPTDLMSLEHWYPQNSTHSLGLKWQTNSRMCAKLLTSIDLRIYEDASDTVFRSYLIPTNCIISTDNMDDHNFHSALMSSDGSLCSSVTWAPLDICRSYKLEIKPKYFSTINGKTSSLEMFTSGSDANCCHVLTTINGTFKSVNDDENNGGCTWLISVAKNSTIWLTFSELSLHNYRIMVYDGPNSTSNLLLDHQENQQPNSVRSQRNTLFVHLVRTTQSATQYRNEYSHQNAYRRGYPQQHQSSKKSFFAHYIAVNDTETPFVAGCGGYIINNGEISKILYPPTESNSSVCKWYLETESESTLLLTSYYSESGTTFPMKIYDGWTTDGKLIYDEIMSSSSKGSISSIGCKMLVLFPDWNTQVYPFGSWSQYTWQVQTLKRRSYFFTSPSDTFSSNEPNDRYPSYSDCRWTIDVKTASKIQLTFVYFATEKYHDFVTVYDGPNIFSPILLEFSGVLVKPVTLTSTTNQLLVRFTTNGQDGGTYQGFYAVYSTDEKLVIESERK